MKTTKAARLKELSQLVDVPRFQILQEPKRIEIKAGKYMVRGSFEQEDQKQTSMAGQFKTFGPVGKGEVEGYAKKLFRLGAHEVIVQEFAEGPCGVAFSFGRGFYVEYSNVFEGVTSGKVKPFVAVLPSPLKKYGRLYSCLKKIHLAFGPSDIEFVSLERPRFVQARPITARPEFDQGLATLKMHLQETGDSWIENEICKVLPEREEQSKAYIKHYLKAIGLLFSQALGRKLRVPDKPFLKISGQYFMSQSLAEQLRLSPIEVARFTLHYATRVSLNDLDKPIDGLFYDDLVLSVASEILKKRSLVQAREQHLSRISKLLDKASQKEDFKSTRPLDSEILLDRPRLCWRYMGYKESQGEVVVAGDLVGPYFVIDRLTEIPNGVVVVTPQLYCWLGKYLDRIKGIICEGGAHTSHISILCREQNIPLRIQVSGACSNFHTSTPR